MRRYAMLTPPPEPQRQKGGEGPLMGRRGCPGTWHTRAGRMGYTGEFSRHGHGVVTEGGRLAERAWYSRLRLKGFVPAGSQATGGLGVDFPGVKTVCWEQRSGAADVKLTEEGAGRAKRAGEPGVTGELLQLQQAVPKEQQHRGSQRVVGEHVHVEHRQRSGG
eukprot:gene8109-biopygen19612